MNIPFSAACRNAAADWVTLLMSGEADAADQQRLQAWRQADPEHERAWQHIEAVTGQLRRLPGGPALSALDQVQVAGRRKALRTLGGLFLLAGTATVVQQSGALHRGDYRASTGERLNLTLPDDTQVVLNTQSAIDVRFTGAQREIILLAGELAIITGHADARPFIVTTAQGRVRPLGTHFTVRQRASLSEVAVLDGAVAIEPLHGPARTLNAGQASRFGPGEAEAARTLNAQDTAWMQGSLIADDSRLADVLAELNRYRPGWLRCDAAVADLRFSGVYPLQDTDRVLAALEQALPIRLRRRTRYWITAEARH